MLPSFTQVFFEDDVVSSALNQIKFATKGWIDSSLRNETVLLNNISDALLKVASNKCQSQIYSDMDVSASRTILDRKGDNNQDKFGADLAVTLSLFEKEELIKQRTALFQLKVGERKGSTVKFLLDVRQIYRVGHNRHSMGRWFMGVCDNTGVWKFASERLVAEGLTQQQLETAAFPNAADRKQSLQVEQSWSSIAEWTLDWLSGAQGEDSDLSNPQRLEAVLSQIRLNEEASRGLGKVEKDFEEQFSQYEILLPRIHIEYIVKAKRSLPD